jgi:hypothetical protein
MKFVRSSSSPPALRSHRLGEAVAKSRRVTHSHRRPHAPVAKGTGRSRYLKDRPGRSTARCASAISSIWRSLATQYHRPLRYLSKDDPLGQVHAVDASAIRVRAALKLHPSEGVGD